MMVKALSLRTCWPVLLLLAGLLLVALLQANQPLFIWVHESARLLPAPFWRLLSVFGDWQSVVTLLLALSWRFPRLLPGIVVGCAVSIVMAIVLKAGFAVPRPPLVLGSNVIQLLDTLPRNGSFPSGHAMASACLAVALWHAAGRQIALVLPLAVGVMLVMLSRLAIGVHWPLDVLTGALVGGGIMHGAMLYAWPQGWSSERSNGMEFLMWCAVVIGLGKLWLHPGLHEEYWLRVVIGTTVTVAGVIRWRQIKRSGLH